jgi:FkbM family methyltransferase
MPRVVCFVCIDAPCPEPILPTFEALQWNVEQHGGGEVTPFHHGLSKAPATATFAYYPHASATSSMYAWDESTKPKLSAAELARRLKAGELPRELSGPRWLRHAPAWLLRRGIARVQARSAVQVPMECTLRRLSDVLREQHVERVDLLKVDVEQAEMDVLQGVDAHDWAKVAVCVVEVHDLDGRLAAMRELLAAHGLSAQEVSQEAVFVGTNVHTLVASRPPTDAAAAAGGDEEGAVLPESGAAAAATTAAAAAA